MQQNHQISRSNVNKSEVIAQDFPKSGFNLTYNSYADYMLGRLHVTGYQHIMPADKFSGRNEGRLTFNSLTVPTVSDAEVRQDNFFVTLRSIDRTFEDAFAPSKTNDMSAAWTVPTFTLEHIVPRVINALGFGSVLSQVLSLSASSTPAQKSAAINSVEAALSPASFFSVFTPLASPMYMADYGQDLLAYMRSAFIGVSVTSNWFDIRFAFLRMFNPFFGENSLLDTLGYNYLRLSDMNTIANNAEITNEETFISSLDVVPQCEYAIRAYYSVWYEFYRDVNLEPVSKSLPKWKDFGSSSILDTSILFLLVRIRSWETDMFTSSLPDDPCRHVYAPICSESFSLGYSDSDSDYLNAEGFDNIAFGNSFRNLRAVPLLYRDSVSGQSRTLYCPFPRSVNDSVISSLNDSWEYYDSYGLDLLTLRRAQMLEDYLKRNFYFGDEYKDRLLGHYGSRLSDQRINRPELLSSSLTTIDFKQEVANVSTSEMTAGDRTATATASPNGDGYEFFAEEFGIVLNIMSIMPRAQYAGICPQNLLYKQQDFPVPEFANQNDEFGRVMEVATNGLRKSQIYNLGMFGHYPYAHGWRSRVDSVHGSFLSSRQNYTFRRFFGLDNTSTAPQLNSAFIHCHPNLGMFADTVLYNGQAYGDFKHHFYVERVLPTPVENI